ncbi:MAG: NAD(P)-dependent oxidoreductase [Chloroflexota bacterium]|nr:NAD(P)-dependent oxidoreductase [Chloroflexota bacterium]
MKALVLAPFDGDALASLGALAPAVCEPWTETRRLYDPQELGERLEREGFGILLIEADFAFEELFAAAPGLKLLGVCRNSLDHVDVEAATRHGALVAHTPGRNAQAVAEHTLGLMLALARHIPRADAYVKSGRWEDPVEPYTAMRGVELEGKTLGVIGLGAIGRRVARLARGFGMSVLAYDPYLGAPGTRTRGATLASLDDLLRASDFVTLHVPASEETYGLLDSSRLAMMKPGSYLINTASYAAVEEAALLDALRSGRLAGAAFDIYESHPAPSSSPLLSMENVVLTPHIGGATRETIQRYSWAMVEEVRRFLSGARPRRLANPAAWRRRGG